MLVASVAMTLLVGVPAQPTTANLKQARQRVVRQFLAVMGARTPPTLADFERFLGPHNEEELVLQLRFEGMRDPLHMAADDATVQRVNRRLLQPTKYRSLFLCFLRRTVPALSTEALANPEDTAVESQGADVVRARNTKGALLFRFPDVESYFWIVAPEGEKPVRVEDLLRMCHPGSCCP